MSYTFMYYLFTVLVSAQQVLTSLACASFVFVWLGMIILGASYVVSSGDGGTPEGKWRVYVVLVLIGVCVLTNIGNTLMPSGPQLRALACIYLVEYNYRKVFNTISNTIPYKILSNKLQAEVTHDSIKTKPEF